jgi:ATP-dependent exoDNAse (exonuclease V) beta subunit
VIADWAEREKALDPERSFIVEAPAGSGKTGLLAQRFLCLLGVVERPETIVAMTFTRKAAAEMRERIQQALADAERQEDFDEADDYQRKTRQLAVRALARSKQLGWDLLADSPQLQIQTIDSLCAMLARQMPVLSEFGDVGQVVEDARDLYKQAARNTLRTLTEGGAQERELFRRVALHFDNEMARLEQQVATMLQKREQWAGLPQSSEDPLVEDFSVLLQLAGAGLRDVFRRAAKVDFTEVARAARKALGTPESPTDLLYSLDYRIEHLLVDEFQDTSRAQYDLVKALTEQWSDGDNRSLFLVGDPMQSIYRFREAEIALFLRCWEAGRLGAVRLERVNLSTNFRSTPELIEWVRATIGPTMLEEDPRMGAVKFRVSQANRKASGIQARVVPLIEDTDGEEEAAEIVRVIRSAPKDASIGILVRARAHVNAILPALRRADIAYKAIEIDALKEQQHVMDLLSLTRAVLHVGDRVAWLACLRAPWCGLTLADLAALAENEPDRTVLDLISDAAKVAALSADGRGRVVRVQQVLSEAVENVGRLPLRDLVERAWLALGGPAVLNEENQRQDVAEFLDLVGNRDEGGVVRDFSLLNERLEMFFARPFVGECQVEVMTIHQAKGLEFDIVLIPQAAKGTRPSDKDLLVWTEEIDKDGSTFLKIAAQPRKGEPSAAYESIEEENKKREEEETKRLFYVACTRAKNELHVFGSVKRKKDGSPAKAGSHTFLGLVWNSVQSVFENALRRRVPQQQSLYDAIDVSAGTLLNRLPENWRMPKFEMSVVWQPALQRAPAAARKITFEWVGDASRHAGTVIHEFLNRIASDGLEKWTAARIEATRPLIRGELLRLGVPATKEPDASNQVVRALANTLGSTRGQWLLKAHAEARSEYSVGGKVQDRLINGTVDRVFRDEDGRFWIVDFKNSDHKGGKREEFLQEEQRRYTPQLETYATLLRRVTSGPIMLGLYFPLLDAWREWSFAAEVAADHETGE